MPPSLQRISMTIPPEVLRKADQLATAWDRSRSWVIAEAIRRMGSAPDPAATLSAFVAEPAVEPYLASAAREARTRHLTHALSLSPTVRLHQAEALAGMARRTRPPRLQIIGFDSLEDFGQWKKARRAGA